ncbi:MAG: hypothetical protein Q4G05_04940 [Clostridia bacterium]|nr:hypothetical protein [Clostridia bacterium]
MFKKSKNQGNLDYRSWITQVDIAANAIITSKNYFSDLYNSSEVIVLNQKECIKHRNILRDNQNILDNLLYVGKNYNFRIPDFLIKTYDFKLKKSLSKYNTEIENRNKDFNFFF